MAFSPMVMPPSSVAPEPIEAPRLTSVLWQSQSASVWSSPKALVARGIAIIDERHTVTDEYLGLDGHAFADEGMTRDLATSADSRALLNLDERADLCLVADLATVKVDEGEDPHVATELDVRRDSLVVGRLTVHRRTGSACANLDSERANDGMTSCG